MLSSYRLSILFVFLFSSAQSYAIELETDITTHLGKNKAFHAGDEIRILLSLSSKAFSLIVYETADDQLIQLFPNKYEDARQLPAGKYYSFGIRHEVFRFLVSSPFGIERVWLFSSLSPLPDVSQYTEPVGNYEKINLNLLQLKKIMSESRNNKAVNQSFVEINTRE